MTDPTAEGVQRLREALGGRVSLPGSAAYAAALGWVFFPDAARRRPACVVQPASAEDVSAVMRIAQAAGCPVTVRGGGLSSNCVADDAIMVDLSVHLDWARPDGDAVVVGGGATMGTVLDALAGEGRTVPIGIVRLAGLGLATRGGVGFLTRSLGLTLDHLVSAEIVLPSGEVRRLPGDSTGDDADLWWAVRGCAPSFGVVTSATFRTHAAAPRFVDRMVVAPDALAAYFDVATSLPRHTSMSAVLGTVPDDPDRPGLLVYTVCASDAPAAVDGARRAATAVAGPLRVAAPGPQGGDRAVPRRVPRHGAAVLRRPGARSDHRPGRWPARWLLHRQERLPRRHARGRARGGPGGATAEGAAHPRAVSIFSTPGPRWSATSCRSAS